MKKEIGILLLLTASAYGVAPHGTRSTDDTRASKAEASLSGYRTTGFDEAVPQKQEAKPEENVKEKTKPRGEQHEKTRD